MREARIQTNPPSSQPVEAPYVSGYKPQLNYTALVALGYQGTGQPGSRMTEYEQPSSARPIFPSPQPAPLSTAQSPVKRQRPLLEEVTREKEEERRLSGFR